MAVGVVIVWLSLVGLRFAFPNIPPSELQRHRSTHLVIPQGTVPGG